MAQPQRASFQYLRIGYLKTSYDLLFKHTMGSDIALQDLVLHHLPKHIVERIDPASIKLIKQSFVPPDLKELHSDLVASCTIDGQEALLYLVVEHQSCVKAMFPISNHILKPVWPLSKTMLLILRTLIAQPLVVAC